MKKVLNYSLLMFLISLLIFACSKEEEVNPTASLESSSASNSEIGYVNIDGYKVGCLKYKDGKWYFEVKKGYDAYSLYHLSLKLYNCKGEHIKLDKYKLEYAKIVIGGKTFSVKDGDFKLEFEHENCDYEKEEGVLKFKILNNELNYALKENKATFYFKLKDADKMLSGAKVYIKTKKGCFKGHIKTCEDYCKKPEEPKACPYTQGYWKTHGPGDCAKGNNSNEWPQQVNANGLTLGEETYDANELCGILNTPVQGTNLGLAHQLIAALLNQANGAYVSDDVQSCIDDAQAWLSENEGIYGTETNNDLTECLADFNESGGENCD